MFPQFDDEEERVGIRSTIDAGMGVYDNADENLFSKFCRKPSAAANFVPSDIFLKCRLH